MDVYEVSVFLTRNSYICFCIFFFHEVKLPWLSQNVKSLNIEYMSCLYTRVLDDVDSVEVGTIRWPEDCRQILTQVTRGSTLSAS
jgi:hypothetical protein